MILRIATSTTAELGLVSFFPVICNCKIPDSIEKSEKNGILVRIPLMKSVEGEMEGNSDGAVEFR